MTRSTVFALALSTASVALAASERPAPIAIVTALKGSAWTVSSDAARTPLTTYDWLAANSTIEVGRASEVSIVFLSGSRYTLGSQSRGRVTEQGVTDRLGSIKQIAGLPPLPRVAAIVPGAANPTAGAVRVRGRPWPLFPSADAATLAANTVLRFAAMPPADRYAITLFDQSHHVLFTATTSGRMVSVPSATIEPGHSYAWEVHALDGAGELQRANSSFATLSDEQAAKRQTLLSYVNRTADPALLALMGLVDSRLGLLVDARSELRRAAARAPKPFPLDELLKSLDARLDSLPDE